ncbi:MAG: zinc ribbon domain-containing protein [Clostridia bacterium]|nr:zinc ribbon domain-containing protein [Clostridia bacterium]
MKTACPRCGANVTFMPSTQKCYCEYCGSEIDISEFNIEKFEENINDTTKYNESTCTSCGASLIVDETTTITRCVYCGSNQFITERFKGEFKPEKIIPFKIDNNLFVSIYSNFVKKKILAPEEFRHNTNISEIKGMYVPFHVFTIDTSTHARGKAMQRSGKHTYYKYFETDFDMTLRSPQDTSKNLDDDIMTSLEPFNFNEQTTFNPVYLNGFSAENGDENINELYPKAKARTNAEVKRTIKKKLGGYDHIKGYRFTTIKKKVSEYTLLPVWFFNTTYNNQKYSYALNGQTGKVVGQIPLSKPKFTIFMTILVVLAMILSVFCLKLEFESDSDDDDSPVPFIWGGVIAAYVTTKARYRNVKKVLDNPIEQLDYNENKYEEYNSFKYKKLFGDDNELKETIVDEEEH